jgi:hypothetical protein
MKESGPVMLHSFTYKTYTAARKCTDNTDASNGFVITIQRLRHQLVKIKEDS